MTVQTVKLAGKRFVIVPEKDFQSLKRRAQNVSKKNAYPRNMQKPRKSISGDQADIALARKVLADPKQIPIDYTQFRKKLGLA